MTLGHTTLENASSRNRRRLFPRDNEKRESSCRTTGPCIVRRSLGMRKAECSRRATVTERIRPTRRKIDSQVSANDDVIFRSRYRLRQNLAQPRDFVTRVRNSGPVPPTKRSSLLLTVSRRRAVSRRATWRNS